MDEAEVRTKKNRNRSKSRKDGIYNYAYNEEIAYWKKADSARVLNENEEKELVHLAPLRALLIRKEKIKKTVNTDETIFYLKSMYWKHNEEPRTFIDDIPTKEPSFEEMTNYLKTFSKYIKDDENMSRKNKCLFGGWILMASKLYKKKNYCIDLKIGYIAYAK